MTTRNEIVQWCNTILQAHQFKDYAPNGLQVQGTPQINKIITAVTASQAAIDFAASQQADMLLVHHGFFWKSEPLTLTGWKGKRIATLLKHNINLLAYHLPLDAHPTLGNNAQLAEKCGWLPEQQFGEQNLLNLGTLPPNQGNLGLLAAHLQSVLGRKPTCIGDFSGSLNKVVWCTGGAQGYFQAAIDAGADVFITGEISEPQYHLANETGVAFISAGHHATERYGVQALGAALAQQFGIHHHFFDENNPA
ncbi:Nif3-like dinuclear metal center hexameric protein [Alysiella filiformis]|uniref:GTP cyclohydrolase 1 type 2 homolog n=1 Tax=Alysiella filiformis DSM 16848 TaxID=1120981 RepID=A0A286EB24_9NEIS|nr:Nif3-like dinuclear metal center hexameric protein [Alysiella filiformis]QMT32222.1 Nif3-like dinuclear metal center hexameric protein [Alysiella filiformis]UBQ56858.1 Nif3-like dinuclear metal center hexameric protein [Alysiella filiformis DSM 16848]SOD68112.1 dinuclear metal center protein, YbgI/SA1388 family [Alysiella filiformis DSM 16848]